MKENTNQLTVTILGSGTSQGVPVIACDCAICQSTDPRDKRLRSSIMLSKNGENVVVDSGPDFRQQMLREGVKTLEAVVFTHEHKDHVAGMDDIRAFNFSQKKDMPIYAHPRVIDALKREFSYVFNGVKYPGIPTVEVHPIYLDPFSIGSHDLQPVEVMHYKLPVLGFRLGTFAYITDAKTIADEEQEKLKNLDVLVINALRIEEHISHFNLEQALEMIAILKPKKAFLTHISHLLGKHQDIEAQLPDHVFLAYDGLKITMENESIHYKF